MNARIALATATLGAFASPPTFAEDGSASTTTAARRMRAQAQLELLPRGTLRSTLGNATNIADAAVAYGIAGAFDHAVTSYLRVGVSPRLVLNIAASNDQSDDADKEIDLRARVLGHYAVRPGVELYASLSPGYTIVLIDSDLIDNATGFAIAGAAGVAYDVSPTLFVSGEIGYQQTFTTTEAMFTTPAIPSKLELSYAHIGIGAGTRF
jgi:Outer membrane protein beta-barrel domain